MSNESPRLFAQLLASIDMDDKPNGEMLALGALMRQWLSQVSDNGRAVDVCVGGGSYDFWVTCGGVEMFVCIKKSARQLQIDAGGAQQP